MEFVNLDELGCAKTCFVNTVSFFESCDDLVDVEELIIWCFKVILNVFKEFFDSIVFNREVSFSKTSIARSLLCLS